MNNKFFLSTAIPYVNSSPHVGHALELVQADVLARYRRLLGNDVFFLNGTDENALKNVKAAEKVGKPVKEFVDENSQRFVNLSKVFNISNDDFIRTTEKRHILGAQKLWSLCEAAGDIYKKSYKGLYCIGCESFKTEKDLVDGLCPDHHTKPEKVEEENYFFKLSKYQDRLLDLIESGKLKITPESRKNEVVAFIRQGLEDFSISRSATRAKNWGIPVLGDSSQFFYVWFDALVNYINAIGFGTDEDRFNSWWGGAYRIHVIGKDITRFHAIYWPAMLISSGLLPPNEIFVHGFITVNGEKMSKSLGTGIDPFQLVEKYGADVVRYFLLREIPSDGDGDFSEEKLVARYNGDLANGLGNLVSRVATLIANNFSEGLEYNKNLIDPKTVSVIDTMGTDYKVGIESFKLHEALSAIWGLVTEADRYVNNTKPWALAKDNLEEFTSVMTNLVEMIYHINKALGPFMPESAKNISEVFDFKEGETLDGKKLHIKKGAGLFPRQ